LQASLQQLVVERASVLRETNVLREALRPLAALVRSINEQLSLVSPAGDAKLRLEAEHKRLKDLNEGKVERPRRLETEVRKLGLQRSERVTAGLADVRRRYEARLTNPSKSDMESLPGEAIADLTALASGLNEQAAQQLTEIVGEILEDIDASFPIIDSLLTSTADRLQTRLSAIELSQGSLTGYDKFSILSSFSSGHSLGGLLSGGGLGVTVSAILTPPIGIAIGLGLGALYAFAAFKNRARSTFATDFRSWLTEQCSQTESIVNNSFQREAIDLQEEVRRLVNAATTERERDIAASLDEAQRLMQGEEKQRQERIGSLEERREVLGSLQRQVRDALTALTAGRTPGPQSSVTTVPAPPPH
jgi:hypothetical protein